jgi:hypothetical protein
MNNETINATGENPLKANDETMNATGENPLKVSATIIPQFAITAKRGVPRKIPKEPHTLLAYAIEKGGRVELTDVTKQELVSRGLPMHRIPNAVYGIRKFFGKEIRTERVGHTISAYTITL